MKDNTLYYPFELNDSVTDFNMNMRLDNMLALFQDAASLHSEVLGCGRSTILANYNIVWVLMRLRVEIARMPKLFEKVTVETWPLPPKLRHNRDFYIRAENKEIIVRASSTWVVMDIDKREISRHPVLEEGAVEYREDYAAQSGLANLKMPEGLTPVFERRILPSDIDINSHVNNAAYAKFMTDTFDYDFLRKQRVKSFEINFVNEVKPGDSIVIKRQEEGGVYYCECESVNEKQAAVKAAIEFTKLG
jgi:acyl-ACP thioesterase